MSSIFHWSINIKMVGTVDVVVVHFIAEFHFIKKPCTFSFIPILRNRSFMTLFEVSDKTSLPNSMGFATN